MSVLVDTNILVRNAKLDDPLHGAASRAIERLVADNVAVHLAPQVIFDTDRDYVPRVR